MTERASPRTRRRAGARALLAAGLLLAGCGDGDGGMDVGAAADLTASGDPARADLARAQDLAPVDQATPQDLAQPADVMRPVDLAPAPDLMPPVDLSMMPGACLCNGNEYCAYVNRLSCQGAGVCTPRPQICNKLLDPVCGCDGKDYGNECMANLAGTDILHKGMCP